MPPQKIVETRLSFGAFTKEADTDYLLARMINFLGSGFHGRTGFFAQQACEKYMKALTVERTGRYSETHCLKELAALCVPYDAYFAEANTLAILERFDMFDQVGRYGGAANFDPLSKGKTVGGTSLAIDPGLEVKGAFIWSVAWLDDLDGFVHKVRSLLDFSKAGYDDCLKSILDNKARSAVVTMWSGSEPLRQVLTRSNRFFK
jgi:HEPN domain-containing protein